MLTNLLVVFAAGLLAPLVLGFFPRVRLPAIVLEIVLGIAIDPSGLGWVKPDAPVSILALVGLAFLLFLSGLEIDVDRLRGRIVKITALGFPVSFVITVLIGIALHAGGFVKSPLFVAIVLVATALGVIFPVLKDSGNIDSNLGEVVIAAASIGSAARSPSSRAPSGATSTTQPTARAGCSSMPRTRAPSRRTEPALPAATPLRRRTCCCFPGPAMTGKGTTSSARPSPARTACSNPFAASNRKSEDERAVAAPDRSFFSQASRGTR